MNRAGDAGSCAALAADLQAGARMLRAAIAEADALDQGAARDAAELAGAMEDLAGALTRFAGEMRDPAPPRSGRPHPHTALASAARRILADESQIRR